MSSSRDLSDANTRRGRQKRHKGIENPDTVLTDKSRSALQRKPAACSDSSGNGKDECFRSVGSIGEAVARGAGAGANEGDMKLAVDFIHHREGCYISKAAEEGLSYGSGTGKCENSNCVALKIQSATRCICSSSFGSVATPYRREFRVCVLKEPVHNSTTGSTCAGSTSGDAQRKIKAMGADNACSAVDAEVGQVGPTVTDHDLGFLTLELDEARKDMVAQANDRWSNFGRRHDFLLFATTKDVRPFQKSETASPVDVVPAVSPQDSVSFGPESLPLILGTSENGVDPPGISVSQNEEMNAVDSTHRQPILCLTACTEGEALPVSWDREFHQCKLNTSGFPQSGGESDSIRKAGNCQGPAKSSSNCFSGFLKQSEEAGRGGTSGQHHLCNFEFEKLPNVDSVVQDSDYVKHDKKADGAVQVSKLGSYVGNMWISRFSAKSTFVSSASKPDLKMSSGQSICLGKEGTNKVGVVREQADEYLGLTSRQIDPLQGSMVKPVNRGNAATYVISKRMPESEKVSLPEKGMKACLDRFSERPGDSLFSEYIRGGSLHPSGDASVEDLNAEGMADFTAAMTSVKDWTMKCASYAVDLSKQEGQNEVSAMCIFCGLNGHSVSQCSETMDCELNDLDRRLPILDRLGTQTNAVYCLRCLGKGHWGAECGFKKLETCVKEMEDSKPRKEGHGQCQEYIGNTQQRTASKNGIPSPCGIACLTNKLRPSQLCENQICKDERGLEACSSSKEVCSADDGERTNNQQGISSGFFNRIDTISHGQNLLHRNVDSMRGGQNNLLEFSKCKHKASDTGVDSVNHVTVRSSGSPSFWDGKSRQDCYSSLGIPKYAESHHKSFGAVPFIPEGILGTIESIRLSRADLFKWAGLRDFNLHARGFFLRLRFGKWEEELGGTGYRMACIRGCPYFEINRASLEVNLGIRRLSLVVDLGDMECTVDSQYVSNQSFTEVELAEWCRATRESGKSLPKEMELKAKVEERKTFSLL